MKKKLLILFFMIGQKLLLAQPYHTLPDSNAVWIVGYTQGPNVYYYPLATTSVNKDDTLINGKFYTKLFMGAFLGAYRSDTSGKAWFVPKDSTQEYLLMDLSKNTGDTIYNLISYGGSSIGSSPTIIDAVVDSVDYVNVGSYLLKKMSLHSFSLCSSDNTMWQWVEKIGALINAGVIFNYMPCGFDLNFTYCMSFNDTIYYYSAFFPNVYPYLLGSCSNFPYNINPIRFFENIAIYPNPFKNSLNVLFNIYLENYNINIYNTQGSICKSFERHSSSSPNFPIDFSGLKSGMYLIKIEDKQKNILVTRKIIKE